VWSHGVLSVAGHCYDTGTLIILRTSAGGANRGVCESVGTVCQFAGAEPVRCLTDRGGSFSLPLNHEPRSISNPNDLQGFGTKVLVRAHKKTLDFFSNVGKYGHFGVVPPWDRGISVVRLEMAKKPNVYRGFWYTERALISSQIVSKGGEWVEGAERG
jgi:hypothetical protein